MAVTLFHIDGFESGSVLGFMGYSNQANSATVTSPVHSGLRSMRMNPNAAVGQLRLANINTTTRIIATSFYIRFATLPDNDVSILQPTPSGSGSLRYDLSDNKFKVNIGGVDTSFGPTLATGQWYRVVMEFDATADPARIRCVIDNDVANEVDQTGTNTPADISDLTFGQAATTRTFDLFLDDWVVSETDGDYEQMRDDWTAQAIESLIPSSDGTHNITTAGDFDSFTGTAFDNSTTNGNTFIGHRPLQLANTADQVIRQELGTTSNYMEFLLENHTLSGDPIGGRGIGVHIDAASGGAALEEARLLLSDDTEVLTTGSLSVINSTEDPGASVRVRRRILLDPTGGWDNTKIDGLKVRVGFSDGAPDANFIDFMVEMLYATAASATPTLDIQEASHGHTADNLALTQHNVLAIQDATHAHTADNAVLGVGLVVQDALHGHTADTFGLTQHHVLAIADASHAHAADNLALTQHNVLAIQDASHGHAADNPALTQHNVLAVDDALHAHAADNLVLTTGEAAQLVIQDATHAHAADEVTLIQHSTLVIQDALHAHRATDHWDGPIHFDGSGTITWTGSTIIVDSQGTGDFWVTADGGSIVHRPMPGPIVEASLTPPSGGAGDQRSFMLRKSTAADSAFYCLHFDANYSHITTLWRDTDGAIANYPGQDTGVAWNGTDSVRFRLLYEGSQATAFVSFNGGAWQQVGTRTIAGLTLVCLVDGGNPVGHTPAVWTRDAIILTQHNALVTADAHHSHSADDLGDIGGEIEVSERQDFVRLRRRRGMGTR